MFEFLYLCHENYCILSLLFCEMMKGEAAASKWSCGNLNSLKSLQLANKKLKAAEIVRFRHCPYCEADIALTSTAIHCRIFRHGIDKRTKQQLDPHMSTAAALQLADEGTIIGCGKQFLYSWRTDVFEIIDVEAAA